MVFRVGPISKTHVEGSVRYFEFRIHFYDFGDLTQRGLVSFLNYLSYFSPCNIYILKEFNGEERHEAVLDPAGFRGKTRFFSTNQPHSNAYMSTDTDYDERNKISRHVFDSCGLSCGTVVV
jgi:hypothetical protein